MRRFSYAILFCAVWSPALAEKRKRAVRSEKKPATVAVDAQANLIQLDADETSLPRNGRRAFSIGPEGDVLDQRRSLGEDDVLEGGGGRRAFSIGPQGDVLDQRYRGDEAAEDDFLKGGSGAEDDLATLASSFSEESMPTRPAVLSRHTRDNNLPMSEVSQDVHHKMDAIIEEVISSKDHEMEALQARVAAAEKRVSSAEEKLMDVQSAKAQMQGLESEALNELQMAHQELTGEPHHAHHHTADHSNEQDSPGDTFQEDRDATPPIFDEATRHR